MLMERANPVEPTSNPRVESSDTELRVSHVRAEDLLAAQEILREYMILTEVERGNAPAATRGLPDVLEVECSDLMAIYESPNAFFLARRHDETLGCVGMKALDDRRVELRRLYVRGGVRGMGVGATLMNHCMRHAQEVGAAQIVLDILPSRADAIAWYMRMGFRAIPPYEELPMPMVFLGLDVAPGGSQAP